MKKMIGYILLMTVCFTSFYSCTVKDLSPRSGKDPYGNSIVPAVRLDRSKVIPEEGQVGDTVQVFGTGIAKHIDEIIIMFNDQSAEIIESTDSSAKIIVPPFASTGNINARVGQEYSFGPKFRVNGDMKVDQSFPSIRGANRAIMDIFPIAGGKFMITGDFTNYDNANIDGGINRVAVINHDGSLNTNFEYGKRLNGKRTGSPSIVNSGAVLNDGKYLVAGAFGSYGGYNNVHSIARLNDDGTLDTMTVDLPSGDTLEVSALVGGVIGSINDLHVQDDGKILVTGLFRYYVKPDYFLTSVTTGRDSTHLDSTRVNFLARLNKDGSLDTTYNYNLNTQSGKESVNGPIKKSILLPDGKLIIVGNFTKYNGKSANRIARIKTDGSLDQTFKPGEGADLTIEDVVVQPDGKLLICGSFNHFDGERAAHIARLNEDGSFDESFKADYEGANGPLLKIGLMPDGKVIATGFFVKYNDIVRNGFVVLNSDGSMNENLNTNSGFTAGGSSLSGTVTGFLQLPAENAFMVIGTFTKFDGYTSNRIMKIEY